MHRPRLFIASLVLAAVAAGGITAAATSSSAGSAHPAAHSAAGPAVRTATVTVAGKTETVLVDSRGLPLYYYPRDTATRSLVTGSLATVWPPLTSATPATGVGGKLTVVSDANGRQVAYNGHLLYTFAYDHPGQVTGQGVQGFFAATPGLAPIGSSPASSGAVAAPPAPLAGGGYGY